MSGLLFQIESFTLTLILGILAGLIFHYYQTVIKKARVSRYWLYGLDFFLWIIMIAVVFLCMLLINGGEMRVYVLIALLSGALIYYHYLSRYFQAAVSAAAQATVNLLTGITNGIKWPFKWLGRRIKMLREPRDVPPPPGGEGDG